MQIKNVSFFALLLFAFLSIKIAAKKPLFITKQSRRAVGLRESIAPWGVKSPSRKLALSDPMTGEESPTITEASITAQAIAGDGAQQKKTVAKIKPQKLITPSGIIRNPKKKEILMGFTAPLSRGIKELGKELSMGIGLVFNKLNKHGGVKKYNLKLLVEDDYYDLTKSKRNIESMFKRTSIFFGLFGSGTLGVIPPAMLDQSLILFPVASTTEYRKPENTSLFFFRASIKQEIEALTKYAVQELYRHRVGIFYEDSVWGRSGFEAAKAALKTFNLKPHVSAVYPRNTVSVTHAANEFAKAMPDVLIMIAHARPTYMLVREALNKGLQNCEYLGTCEAALSQKRLVEARGIFLTTSSVVPNPWKSDIEIAKEYRKAMKKQDRDPSIFAFEGFIMGKVFEKALQSTKVPFTKEKIKKSLESMKNLTFKGLPIDFDPNTRTLCHHVWLNVGQENSWRMIS